MQSGGFTHVSVHAHYLDESARFYRDLFGMEEIPSPDFPFEVRWLGVGNLALHLFESTEQAPTGHHFGLDVEAFEEIYQKAEEMGVRIQEEYFSRVYELPDGAEVLVDGTIPQWEGDLFVAALRGERLWRLELDAAGNVTGREELLSEEVGRIRNVTQAPDGSLWITTSNLDSYGQTDP